MEDERSGTAASSLGEQTRMKNFLLITAALVSFSACSDRDRDADQRTGPVVHVFTDANCLFCNQLWTSARPWVEVGKVQLRHAIVGIIRAGSAAMSD